MTADTLIVIGVIVAAVIAMALLGRGLPSRSKWRGSKYGASKNLRGKDAMRLAFLALNEGRFGLNPFESDDEEDNDGRGKGG